MIEQHPRESYGGNPCVWLGGGYFARITSRDLKEFPDPFALDEDGFNMYVSAAVRSIMNRFPHQWIAAQRVPRSRAKKDFPPPIRRGVEFWMIVLEGPTKEEPRHTIVPWTKTDPYSFPFFDLFKGYYQGGKNDVTPPPWNR